MRGATPTNPPSGVITSADRGRRRCQAAPLPLPLALLPSLCHFADIFLFMFYVFPSSVP